MDGQPVEQHHAAGSTEPGPAGGHHTPPHEQEGEGVRRHQELQVRTSTCDTCDYCDELLSWYYIDVLYWGMVKKELTTVTFIVLYVSVILGKEECRHQANFR